MVDSDHFAFEMIKRELKGHYPADWDIVHYNNVRDFIVALKTATFVKIIIMDSRVSLFSTVYPPSPDEIFEFEMNYFELADHWDASEAGKRLIRHIRQKNKWIMPLLLHTNVAPYDLPANFFETANTMYHRKDFAAYPFVEKVRKLISG